MSTHGELERPTEGLARELEWMAENTPALTQLERSYLRWSAAAMRSARGEAMRNAANWLRRNANAEREPKARAALIEAHNAILSLAAAEVREPEEMKK